MIKRKNNWVVATILLLITIFFFYPTFFKGLVPFPADLLLAEYQPWRSYSFDGYAPGGIPNKAQYFDTLRQLYPWKTFAIEAVKNGTLPLWNPYNFSGTPLFANFQSALLYPLNIVYAVLPQTAGWTFQVLFQVIASLVGMYILSRKYKLSIIASFFTAISYSFSLYMTVFLEYNIMGHFMYLLPFAILGIEYITENKIRGYAMLLLIVPLGIFAGHLQLFGGIFVYSILYALIKLYLTIKKDRKLTKKFFLFFTAIAIGVGIGAVQLIPGIELIANSARSSHDFKFFIDSALIRPEQLILYFIPDLFGNPAVKNYLLPFSYPSKAIYIGMAPILLFITGLFLIKKIGDIKTPLIVSLIFASIVFLTPVSFLLYKLNLPIISSSSPSNYVFLVSFGFCITAGYGLDRMNMLKKKLVIILLFSIWIVIGSAYIISAILDIQISRSNFIFSLLLLAAVSLPIILLKIRSGRLRTSAQVFIVIVTMLELFYFFHKFNPFVPARHIYPPTPIGNELKNLGIDRVWGYGHAGIASNFQTQIGFYSPEGYDPLYPRSYAKLVASSQNGVMGKNTDDTTRSDAIIPNGYRESSFLDNAARLKILSLTGSSYILDKTENASTDITFPSDQFERIKSLGEFHLMKYKNAYPRFFLTTDYVVYGSDKDFARIFYSGSFDGKETILLEKEPSIKNPATTGSASLKSYKPMDISIRTQTNGDSLLFLSDTYYPGWNVFIDGKKSEILKAHYTFRVVKVPKGIHLVEFRYRPLSVYYGLGISIVSIIVGIFFLRYVKKL